MIHCVFFPVACGLSDDEAYINCVIVYIAYTHTDMRMKNDLKTFDEGLTLFFAFTVHGVTGRTAICDISWMVSCSLLT